MVLLFVIIFDAVVFAAVGLHRLVDYYRVVNILSAFCRCALGVNDPLLAFVLPRIFDSSDESKSYFDCWIVLLGWIRSLS